MKKQVVLMLTIVNCCLALSSYAMPLGEINDSGGGGSTEIATSLRFSWETPEGYEGERVSMYWEVVTPFDVGKTFRQSSATSESFGFFASMLSSGTDDAFLIGNYLPSGGGSGVANYESAFLSKFVPTQSVDFYGYEITEVGLTVDSLTIDSPGQNPNGDGLWTDYSYDVTFTIYGIPEPATGLLLGLGGLALLRKRKT